MTAEVLLPMEQLSFVACAYIVRDYLVFRSHCWQKLPVFRASSTLKRPVGSCWLARRHVHIRFASPDVPLFPLITRMRCMGRDDGQLPNQASALIHCSTKHRIRGSKLHSHLCMPLAARICQADAFGSRHWLVRIMINHWMLSMCRSDDWISQQCRAYFDLFRYHRKHVKIHAVVHHLACEWLYKPR